MVLLEILKTSALEVLPMASENNQFRITISPKTQQGYPVLVNGPVLFGNPTGMLQIDVDSQQFQQMYWRIREERCGGQLLQDFGSLLFSKLLQGQLATAFELSWKHIESIGDGQQLRITLQVLADDLQALPWEMMYHPQRRLWLCTSRSSPMSRYVDAVAPATTGVSFPLKILVCVAEPNDLPSTQSGDEVESILAAIDKLGQQQIVDILVLRGAQRDSLRKALEEFRPHVFHFVGHGDQRGQVSGLLLQRNDGSSEFLAADILQELLRQCGTVLVAVLNACESHLAAITLARQGIAAVGMQDPIRSEAAINFGRCLYEALATGMQFDAAVNCARFAVRLECGDDRKDWWLPVVFLPGGEADLFKIEKPATVVQVCSSPNGARIFVDGLDTAKTTPDTVVIEDDKAHRIAVSKAGYADSVPQQVSSSTANQPVRLEFVLKSQSRANLPTEKLRKVDSRRLKIICAVVGVFIALVGIVFGVLGLQTGEGEKTEKARKVMQADNMIAIAGGELFKGSWDSSITVKLLQKYGLSGGSALVQLFQVPQRSVEIADFLIDKTEVTNAEYRKFLKYMQQNADHSLCHPDEPSGKDHTPKYWRDPRFNKDRQPVVGVDWHDAYAFARWAGKQLPTEDQWELAARGRDKRPYPWGTDYDKALYGGDGSGPVPVDDLTAGYVGAPVGMAGNVAEWTSSPQPDGDMMMFRGGAWRHGPGQIYGLTFLRLYAPKTTRKQSIGFRCVRDISAGPAPKQMIRIQGGTVSLGGDDTPLLRLMRKHKGRIANVDEAFLGDRPTVVYVPSFRIDRCEVTNAEYRVFLDYIRQAGDHSFCHPDEPANKDHTPKYWHDPRFNKDVQPVVGVDWYDAYAYARWVGKSLASGDQWEFAAKGNTKRLYPWGDTFDQSFCACAEAKASSAADADSYPNGRSASGAVNMAGNVMEWTTEDFGKGGGTKKILRGGAFSTRCQIYGLTYLRRMGASRTYRGNDVGFRCVADVAKDDR